MGPVGILLAAGSGTRFDPSGANNKLMSPYGLSGTVAGSSARHLRAVLPRVLAVVAPGPGAAALAAELQAAGCAVTTCPDAGEGMGASLRHAVRMSLPAPFGWVVALADMPDVLPSTIEALVDALADGAQVAAPAMGGRRGNPVAFGPDQRDALLAMHGDEGARRLLLSQPVTLVEVADPGIFRDIDTRSDLRTV